MKYKPDEYWPAVDLEFVDKCPFCYSKKRDLVRDEVEDWTFYVAPGKWYYWRCQSCAALYLNPRPTNESIGRAYSKYYTHGDKPQSSLQKLKILLKHECLSHTLNISLTPRLFLPKKLSWLLHPLNRGIAEEFGLNILAKTTKGKLLDVGCGGGKMLKLAEQMGWDAMGLELDPDAVESCRRLGLKVGYGGYEKLDDYPMYYDCIIFSHVLEHVHDPIDALNRISGALKAGGILLLSCPNAMSSAGEYFGRYWRGLEAPRHLAIPTLHFLIQHLIGMGFTVEQRLLDRFPTIQESLDIERNALPDDRNKTHALSKIQTILGSPESDQVDFIELVCKKNFF